MVAGSCLREVEIEREKSVLLTRLIRATARPVTMVFWLLFKGEMPCRQWITVLIAMNIIIVWDTDHNLSVDKSIRLLLDWRLQYCALIIDHFPRRLLPAMPWL